MKKIETIIETNRLYNIQVALKALGFKDITLSEAKGFNLEFIPKIKIELICSDDQTEHAVSTIIDTADPIENKTEYLFIPLMK
ncbi:MAG TPA: P-II family nitrogen regulator [Ignavibacteriaceae bacterium]|nr:P-II family nitrogen regulator [Ignavibacteriaceae bacterium]